MTYYEWLNTRTRTDRAIMAGERTFVRSRVLVERIGRMAKIGAPLGEILEDYPAVTEEDVRHAQEYVRREDALAELARLTEEMGLYDRS